MPSIRKLISGRPLSAVISIVLLTLGGCAAPRLTQEDLSVSVPPPLALADGRIDTLVFAVCGDTQLGRDRKDRAYDSDRRKRRRAVASAIAEAAPQFVLHVGDLVEKGGNPALWEIFREDAEPLLRPRFFYPVAGNHEYKGGLSEAYFNLFEGSINRAKSYAFGAGSAFFIMLDSAAEPSPSGEDPRNVHARWLRERLAEAMDSRYLIVVLHHPAFSSGRRDIARFLFRLSVGHTPRPQERRLRGMLADHHARRLARDPKSRTVVFSGHSHFYEAYRYEGVDFIVTIGSAPSRTPDRTPPPYRTAAYRGDHYVLVTATQDSLDFCMTPVGQGEWVQGGNGK